MAKAKAKTTLGKVKAAVVEAATVVAKAADAKVVQPVGQALGLTEPPKPKPKPGRAKRAAAKRPAKDATKPSLKATVAEKAKTEKPAAKKGSAAATLTRNLGAAPKPKKADGPPGRGPGKKGG